MMHSFRILRGRSGSLGHPLVKQTIRFCRRLREHGIWHYETPVLVDDGHSAVRLRVGGHLINIFNDGSCTRALLRTNDHVDAHAIVAQSRRMHATYLAMAAQYRRIGRRPTARTFLSFAMQERCNERTDQV